MFDGKGSSFLDYEQQVRLRMCATRTDPASRASAVVMHVSSVPRRVCSSAGGGHVDDQDGVAQILGILRSCFAPGDEDAIYQQAMRFLRYRCTDMSVD